MAKVLKPFMTSQTANVCLIIEKAKSFRWTSSHSHYLSAMFGSLNQTLGDQVLKAFISSKGKKYISQWCFIFCFPAFMDCFLFWLSLYNSQVNQDHGCSLQLQQKYCISWLVCFIFFISSRLYGFNLLLPFDSGKQNPSSFLYFSSRGLFELTSNSPPMQNSNALKQKKKPVIHSELLPASLTHSKSAITQKKTQAVLKLKSLACVWVKERLRAKQRRDTWGMYRSSYLHLFSLQPCVDKIKLRALGLGEFSRLHCWQPERNIRPK